MSANPPACVGRIACFRTKAAPCRYQFRRPFQCHFAASLSERPCGTRSCWSFCPNFPAPGCRLRKCDFSKSRPYESRGKEGSPAVRPAGLRAAAASAGTPFFSCLPLHQARLLNTHILFRRVWPHTKFPRRTCRSLEPSAPPSALLTGRKAQGLYPMVFLLSFQASGRLQKVKMDPHTAGPSLPMWNHLADISFE